MDMNQARMIAAGVAVVAFNVPICIAAVKFNNGADLKGVLSEKSPDGVPTPGSVSYSRVAGMIGAVVVASLFWIVSNIVVATAIIKPSDVPTILSNMGTIFLVGAALFLPYAFNQLKAVLQ